MTRPIELPTEAQVEKTLQRLRADDNGPVPVTKLAAALGMSNATFWRHFRDIAQQVSAARRDALHRSVETAAKGVDSHEATRLRREVAALRRDLELAIAHLQRLTVENEALRNEVMAANKIVRLHDR